MNQQQQNQLFRTLSRRHRGLNEFYCQIYPLDSAVSNPEKSKARVESSLSIQCIITGKNHIL